MNRIIKCETTGCQQCAPHLVRIRKLAISLLVLGLLGAAATGCVWGTVGVIHHLEILAICSLVSFLLGAGLLLRYKHKGSSMISEDGPKVKTVAKGLTPPIIPPAPLLAPFVSDLTRSPTPATPLPPTPLPATALSTEEMVLKRKRAAATKIRRVWLRFKKRALTRVELERVKPLMDSPSALCSVPRAPAGATAVYLPIGLPMVLKLSGSRKSQARFAKMQEARDLCTSNRYETLVIPKARIYGEFIVESRLPLTVHKTKEQIGFYIENRERFTRPIKEFTGFLCQSSLDDITGGNMDPFGSFSYSPIGRYDNVALYLEGGQGYIGLVDLETFERSTYGNPTLRGCREAIRLFPYHFDEILTVAKKYDPNIERYLIDLKTTRDHALLRFKLAYEDHLAFVKEKGITPDNPLKMSEISPERREHLKKLVVSKVREETCLGEKPDEMIPLFEEAFPFILDSTTNFIFNFLKSGTGAETISSYSALLSYRTLRFAYDCPEYKELASQVAAKLTMVQLKELQRNRLALSIIERIFKGLAEGGDIAYYNPSFGYGRYATHCIFC